MTKIAIIGAGQSGLQTGIGLLQAGFEVTIVNNRTADEVKNGKVMSSQFMFNKSLDYERDLGIEFWGENECPRGTSLGIAVPNPEKPGEKMISWVGDLNNYGLAVDQRVKFPRWMDEFEKQGGNLIIKDADEDYIEQLADEYDLVVVAAGKGSIVSKFDRDAEKSMYDKPMRALALTYVTGMTANENDGVRFNMIPTVGEYFVFPALTTTGPCHIMVFEGIPGGPMDCWGDIKTPEEHLAKSKEILNTFLPWEAARCENIKLTDDNGILAGRFPPTVRKPVWTLPSGKNVLGMADVVVLNDPITGQGSNNASKCSKVYMDSIIANKGNAYDKNWMQATFDKYWDTAQHISLWTNTLLGPPPEHILNLLGAAGQIQSLADMFANNFSDPTQFFPWWLDPELTGQLINEHAGKV